jgi:putative peptidoglycan lipid II flippase
VFANTYGAGAELDAYNAAFRIPEIALDVLVAAGLTSPFVPIFSSLRHDASDDEPANDFGRTVLTGAVGVMAIASTAIFIVAPSLGEVVGGGFDQATRELYVQLLRINCLAQVLFAASIALGEILVANRRFVFYALARSCTTGIISDRPVLRAVRGGRHGLGAVGARAHLAIRAIGAPDDVPDPPGFAVRTAAFGSSCASCSRGCSRSPSAAHRHYFTRVATGIGVGAVIAQPGWTTGLPVASSACRSRWRSSRSCRPRTPTATGRPSRAVLVRNLVTIGILTALAAAALFVLSGTLVEVLLGGGRFGPDDVARTSAVVAAFALSIPFDALAYPLSRGLYATHDTLRQVIASFAGLAVVVVATQALVASLDILAIPLGYAAGVVAKDALLAMFLAARVRRIGVSGSPLDGRDDGDEQAVALRVRPPAASRGR